MDLGNKLKSAHLGYADDFKMFRSITNTADSEQFQADIDRFVEWCRNNKLALNIPKCKVMSFYRTTSPILNTYRIGSDHKLTFVNHIDTTIAKANSMLGFISRICKNMDNPHALKSLYTAFVRSSLEFGAPVWQPYHAVHKNRLESIQKRFTRLAIRKLRWNPETMPSYLDRCMLLNIDSLEERRKLQEQCSSTT